MMIYLVIIAAAVAYYYYKANGASAAKIQKSILEKTKKSVRVNQSTRIESKPTTARTPLKSPTLSLVGSSRRPIAEISVRDKAPTAHISVKAPSASGKTLDGGMDTVWARKTAEAADSLLTANDNAQPVPATVEAKQPEQVDANNSAKGAFELSIRDSLRNPLLGEESSQRLIPSTSAQGPLPVLQTIQKPEPSVSALEKVSDKPTSVRDAIIPAMRARGIQETEQAIDNEESKDVKTANLISSSESQEVKDADQCVTPTMSTAVENAPLAETGSAESASTAIPDMIQPENGTSAPESTTPV